MGLNKYIQNKYFSIRYSSSNYDVQIFSRFWTPPPGYFRYPRRHCLSPPSQSFTKKISNREASNIHTTLCTTCNTGFKSFNFTILYKTPLFKEPQTYISKHLKFASNLKSLLSNFGFQKGSNVKNPKSLRIPSLFLIFLKHSNISTEN